MNTFISSIVIIVGAVLMAIGYGCIGFISVNVGMFGLICGLEER